MPSQPYLSTHRRMLLDMHVPAWDPAFLADYDPEALADCYAEAGVAGVLFYAKSHLGLNYWPAPVGAIHPAASHRDLVGELLAALKSRDIAPAIYHTLVFDNWAIDTHPEWAVVPISTRTGDDVPWHGPRYGTACPNQSGYRAYEAAQITALLERYDVEVLWLDMTFWNAVCVCPSCTSRFAREFGGDIPDTIDWRDPRWNAFQSARERWLEEFVAELYATARSVRPDVALTHNFGGATHGWYAGLRSDVARLDTFAAGDIYGGKEEQLLVSKLMQHLGERQPAEFMTTRTPDLANHVELKSEHLMTVEAFATIAHHGAFLFIDAIDPRGTVNPGVYERVGRVFARIAPYEQHLGGEPVADVALYYSDDASIHAPDSGRSAAAVTVEAGRDATRKSELAHIRAVTEAATSLQRAHLPFSILTRGSLNRLAEHRVLVLADVIRMDEHERQLVREFVAGGGRVYASGRTSLLDTAAGGDGTLVLGDLFGVETVGHEPGAGIYLSPRDPRIAKAIAPEHHLGHGFREGWVGDGYADPALGLPRVTAAPDATVLATLALPYAYPSPGSRAGRDFASIHSSPPWEETEWAGIVERRVGRGRTIYSVAPIERGSSDTDRRVFSALVRDLLEGVESSGSSSDPDIWLTIVDQPERGRLVVSALNYREDARPAAVPFSFWCTVPEGCRATSVRRAEDSGELARREAGRRVDVEVGELDLFAMFFVDYVRDA